MECYFSLRMVGERQKGTPREAWKLQSLFLLSKPASCRCQSGIKSSKLGNRKPKNATGNLKMEMLP